MENLDSFEKSLVYILKYYGFNTPDTCDVHFLGYLVKIYSRTYGNMYNVIIHYMSGPYVK